MSHSIAWVGRGIALVCVALATVFSPSHTRGSDVLAFQVGGYLVIAAVMAAWSLIEARTPAHRSAGPRFTVALAVVCAIAGAIAASPDGVFAVVLAAIAALVAGSDTPLRSSLVVMGLGLAGFFASAFVWQHTIAGGLLVGLPPFIVTGLALGLHRRTYRVQAEQLAELLERTRQVQELRSRADVLDERTRIAREIHDVLAHSLGGLGIQIQAARAVLTDHGDVAKAVEVLVTAQRLASEGLVETRRAVHALRSDTLSLDDELRDLADTHGGLHRTQVAFVIDGTSRQLPAPASMALLRVAQEAAVNAAKHAPHQPIDLRLEYAPDRVRLTVTNLLGRSGAGRTASSGPSTASPLRTADTGYGLAGMRERLLLIGGSLHAGPRDDVWDVVAELPGTKPNTMEG